MLRRSSVLLFIIFLTSFDAYAQAERYEVKSDLAVFIFKGVLPRRAWTSSAHNEISGIENRRCIDVQLPTSITIQMRTPAGVLMGGLQCIFARAPSIASIGYGGWASVIGAQVFLEVR